MFDSEAWRHASAAAAPLSAAAAAAAAAWRAHLQADRVLVLPLHVVDVPGHALHRVDGIQHHVVAFRVLVQVIFYFLRKKKKNPN